MNAGAVTTGATDLLTALTGSASSSSTSDLPITYLRALLEVNRSDLLTSAIRRLAATPSARFTPALAATFPSLVDKVDMDTLVSATMEAVAKLPVTPDLVPLVASVHAVAVASTSKAKAKAAQRERLTALVQSAAVILADRPPPPPVATYYGVDHAKSAYMSTMDALGKFAGSVLHDLTLVARCLEQGVGMRTPSKDTATVLRDAAAQLGWTAVAPVAVRMTAKALGSTGIVAASTVGAVLDMAEALETDRPAGAPSTDILRLVVDAICARRACEHTGNEVAPPPAPQSRWYNYSAPPTPPTALWQATIATLVRVCRALARVETADGAQLLERLTVYLSQSMSGVGRARNIVGPVALALAQSQRPLEPAPASDATAVGDDSAPPTWVVLTRNVLVTLAAAVDSVRTNVPKDWAIVYVLPVATPSSPALVNEVARFLQDPARKHLSVKDYKNNLLAMQSVLGPCADVTCTIDPLTKPRQSLILTKRLETYRLACIQAARDVQQFQALKGALPARWAAIMPAAPAAPNIVTVPTAVPATPLPSATVPRPAVTAAPQRPAVTNTPLRPAAAVFRPAVRPPTAAATRPALSYATVPTARPAPNVVRAGAAPAAGPAPNIRTGAAPTAGPAPNVVRTGAAPVAGPAPNVVRTGAVPVAGPAPNVFKVEPLVKKEETGVTFSGTFPPSNREPVAASALKAEPASAASASSRPTAVAVKSEPAAPKPAIVVIDLD